MLPPPQLTVLSVPAETGQLLVPSHVVVQFDVQVPWQLDWPSQVVVQPVHAEANRRHNDLCIPHLSGWVDVPLT
jgi:hypothetical protein